MGRFRDFIGGLGIKKKEKVLGPEPTTSFKIGRATKKGSIKLVGAANKAIGTIVPTAKFLGTKLGEAGARVAEQERVKKKLKKIQKRKKKKIAALSNSPFDSQPSNFDDVREFQESFEKAFR